MSEKSTTLVWLIDERRLAELVRLHAYCATVKYTQDGVEYEIDVPDDDFIYLEEPN